MTIELLILIYILGVIAAVVLIAWLNSRGPHSDDIPIGWCALSWSCFIFPTVALIVVPIDMLYEYLLKKFEK